MKAFMILNLKVPIKFSGILFLNNNFQYFLNCRSSSYYVDKPARLTIRVIWVLVSDIGIQRKFSKKHLLLRKIGFCYDKHCASLPIVYMAPRLTVSK